MLATVQINLIKAKAEDLKEFMGWFDSANGQVRKYNLKFGMIYFIKSTITSKFEGPYRLTESTDKSQLAEYLKLEMIFIPPYPLENEIKIIK